MRIITRYIAGRTLRGILLSFLVVTAVIMLVDFVEATRNIGDNGSLSLLKIAGLTLLKIPQLIEETIPFVVLFGVMSTLYGLNKRSELVVLRASGISAWKFLRPAVFVSAAIGVIWSLLLNPFAAKSMDHYQNILSRAASDQIDKAAPADPSFARGHDIWLREGNSKQQIVVHGKQSRANPAFIKDSTFYFYNVSEKGLGETRFSHRIDAESAVLKAGYWQLRNMTENMADGSDDTGKTLYAQFASLPTRIQLSELRETNKISNKTSFWQLPSEISRAEAAGFSNVSLRMQWHRLLALPLTLIAMTVIAAGVSMRNVRAGGGIRLMLAGGLTGFAVYFSNTIMSAFGEAQSLPIATAAWSVPSLVLLIGLAYLARIEDG